VAQVRSAWQSLKEEQQHVDAEILKADGDAREKLKAKRNELQARQAAQKERLHQRATKLQESWDAKIASIKQKAASAKADAKTRHQQHVERLSRFAAAQKASFQDLFARPISGDGGEDSRDASPS